MASKYQIKIYNISGKASSQTTLSQEIFGQKENEKLISQVFNILRSNQRRQIAHTKTRGEVSGGGQKPFRQKGTGRARAGSSRSPLWIGGGITFGPRKNKNFKKHLSKKIKRLSLKMVLSEKFQNNKLIILNNFDLDKISTRRAEDILNKLPLDNGNILVILEKSTPILEASLANLPYLKTIQVVNLNILDILNHDWIITTVDCLKKINELLNTKEVKNENHPKYN